MPRKLKENATDREVVAYVADLLDQLGGFGEIVETLTSIERNACRSCQLIRCVCAVDHVAESDPADLYYLGGGGAA